MPDTQTQQVDRSQLGQEYAHFSVPEFLDYERGLGWYIVAGVVAGVCILGSFLVGAPTLAIATLLFVGVYFLLHHRTARVLDVHVHQHGLVVDDTLYSAADIDGFWLVWQPPFVYDIKIRLRQRMSSVITLHAVGQDPAVMRAVFAALAPEEQHSESMSDLIIRTLRL